MKSSNSFFGTPISERVRRIHSKTAMSETIPRGGDRPTDEQPIENGPEGPASLIRDSGKIDIVTVELLHIVA